MLLVLVELDLTKDLLENTAKSEYMQVQVRQKGLESGLENYKSIINPLSVCPTLLFSP